MAARCSRLAIDVEAALLEYLDMFYRLGRAGKALDRFGVIDFATTVAPGVRDVLLTGKVYEATRRHDDGVPAYDAVVLDAPPTGRIGHFLNVNTEVAGIAKVGPDPASRPTRSCGLLKSDRTRDPLRLHPRGDARPGDPRRNGRAERDRASDGLRDRQPGPSARAVSRRPVAAAAAVSSMPPRSRSA